MNPMSYRQKVASDTISGLEGGAQVSFRYNTRLLVQGRYTGGTCTKCGSHVPG